MIYNLSITFLAISYFKIKLKQHPMLLGLMIGILIVMLGITTYLEFKLP
jgi:hypothetical protein